MKETKSISVTVRSDFGKAACRRLRQSGKIPGILYGHDVDPLAIITNIKDLVPIIEHPSIISLTVDGDETVRNVLLKDSQYDFLHANLIHVDFQQVRMDEPISAEIPIEIFGEPTEVAEGGQVDQVLHEIEIECLPDKLPEKIEVDVSGLKFDEPITVGDLKLPPEVEIVDMDPNAVVVQITRIWLEEEETEAEQVTGEQEPEVIVKGKKDEKEESN